MTKRNTVDQMNQSTLRILSDYEQLTPVELWYEFGEDDAVGETITEREILSRLESLAARGFVERVTEAQGDDDVDHLGYRVRPTGARASKQRKKLRKNGVLKIALTKSEEAKKKKIKIKVE